MKIIQQGAEAIIKKDKEIIIKDRINKSYRISVLDSRLRKQRTKRESNILQKASKIISVPTFIKTDEKEKIQMSFIPGLKLSESLDSLKNNKIISEQIGKNIALLHDNNIIHGDLTTSNMIYNKKQDKLFFIDFGLSFQSDKIEDKAVDLHLIKQALEAKHFINYEYLWNSILEGYKHSINYKQTLSRLEKVEKRGRYKGRY